MGFEFVIADVFTDVALAGNQLAVFGEADDIDEPLLGLLAREIGFSETVFVYGDGRVRIFTPEVELPFAGHPLLGAAAVLRARRGGDQVALRCAQGLVPVTFDERGRGTMVQPVPTWAPWPGDARALSAALGGASPALPLERYDNGPHHLIVVVDQADLVAALRPDLAALAELVGEACVSVVAPRQVVDRVAYKSRVFAPGSGIGEDPATGSAAGPLAVHLARHGRLGWGQTVEVLQGVELLRPSTLYAAAHLADRADADAGAGVDVVVGRVEVAGDVVVVGRGTFEL